MIAKLFGFLISMVGVTLLFWLGLVYDRLPAGWPNSEVKCCIVVHFTFHMPWAGAVTAAVAQYAALRDQEAAAARHSAVVFQRQGAITTAAQSSAMAARVQIEWRTRTIIKEAHNVLTPEVDLRYPLPVGLWRVYNASARGVDLSAVPDPAARADDAPSGVAASTAGDVFAANNGKCLVALDHLARLQRWAAGEGAVK